MADNGILGKILAVVDAKKRVAGRNLSDMISNPSVFFERSIDETNNQLLAGLDPNRSKDQKIEDAISMALSFGPGSIKTLYHGGRPFTKWDPATVGTGERGILAQGPGLYAGDVEDLAKVYLKYGGDEAAVKKLLVEDANIIDPAKAMGRVNADKVANAEAALDHYLGWNAQKNGLRTELLYRSGKYDKEKVRKILVDEGIDGLKQDLGNAYGSEYVIFNPEAIKKDVKFDAAKGIGQTPNNQEIGYFGFETMMPVSKFQELHAPISKYKSDTLKYLAEEIEKGRPLGQPMLYVEWNGKKGTWDITGHEGRHRAEITRQLLGEDFEIPVHVFPRGGLRASTITPEMRNAPFRSENSTEIMKILEHTDALLKAIEEGTPLP